MKKTHAKQRQFKAIIERDEDGMYIGKVPSLPGCATQARTLEQLQKRLQEAVELCLSVAKDDPDYRAAIEELAYEPSFVGLETVTV